MCDMMFAHNKFVNYAYGSYMSMYGALRSFRVFLSG